MIRLSSEPQAGNADMSVLQDAIDQSNMVKTGVYNYTPVRLFLRDDEGRIRGGLVGDNWGGWFHVRVVWIDEPLRQQGYGTQLLQAAEAEARAAGSHQVHLETFSFQARGFYERLGYEVFAYLPDYPPGHQYYYLRKSL